MVIQHVRARISSAATVVPYLANGFQPLPGGVIPRASLALARTNSCLHLRVWANLPSDIRKAADLHLPNNISLIRQVQIGRHNIGRDYIGPDDISPRRHWPQLHWPPRHWPILHWNKLLLVSLLSVGPDRINYGFDTACTNADVCGDQSYFRNRDSAESHTRSNFD